MELLFLLHADEIEAYSRETEDVLPFEGLSSVKVRSSDELYSYVDYMLDRYKKGSPILSFICYDYTVLALVTGILNKINENSIAIFTLVWLLPKITQPLHQGRQLYIKLWDYTWFVEPDSASLAIEHGHCPIVLSPKDISRYYFAWGNPAPCVQKVKPKKTAPPACELAQYIASSNVRPKS